MTTIEATTVKVYLKLDGEDPVNGVTPTRAEVWFKPTEKAVTIYVNGHRGKARSRVWDPGYNLCSRLTDQAIEALTYVCQQAGEETP